MKRLSIFLFLTVATVFSANAQKYLTKSGYVKFFSDAKMEDITAKNNQLTALLDASNGEFAFIALIRSFEFPNQTMQEHFNTHYMESGKYPKSTFSGSITDWSSVNAAKNGTYSVTVSGTLKIHGVSKKVKIPAKVVVNGNTITTKATFNVTLSDYGIVNDKSTRISNTIQITVNAALKKQ